MAPPTVIDGGIGGIVATIVMTIVMGAVGDDSPTLPAMFWSTFIGDGQPTDYKMQGMVLHLLYGAGAGVTLVILASVASLSLTSIVMTFGIGLGWGIVLFLFGAGFWMKSVLGLDPEMGEVAQFLVLHLLYGIVLSGWLLFAPTFG